MVQGWVVGCAVAQEDGGADYEHVDFCCEGIGAGGAEEGFAEFAH